MELKATIEALNNLRTELEEAIANADAHAEAAAAATAAAEAATVAANAREDAFEAKLAADAAQAAADAAQADVNALTTRLAHLETLVGQWEVDVNITRTNEAEAAEARAELRADLNELCLLYTSPSPRDS